MKLWKDIFEYWQTFEVKQIEVVDFNPEVHDALYWFHKRKKLGVYLNQNPKNDTAKHLTKGRIKASDEVYAAFAIYATLKEFSHYDKTREVQLQEVVRDALFELDDRKWDYWAGQAKHVLPGCEGSDAVESLLRRKGLSRKEYVALSAQLWKHMAEEWVTLKFPSNYNY